MSGRCGPLSNGGGLFTHQAIVHSSCALFAKMPSDHMGLLVATVSRDVFDKEWIKTSCIGCRKWHLLRNKVDMTDCGNVLPRYKVDFVGQRTIAQAFEEERAVLYLIVCWAQLKNKFHAYYVKVKMCNNSSSPPLVRGI